ncbi:MAG: hypothetical protein R3C14_24745 [Caldilineaceae bacterium]
MTVAFDHPSSVRQDPAYQQAMTHFQRGEWGEAIAALEALQRQYPQQRSIARALDEARFKAGLDAATQVRAKRWTWNSRPRLLPLALLVLLLLLGYQGIGLVQQRILPAMEQARLLAQYRGWLSQAQAFVQAGAYDDAEQEFRKLLALAANEPDEVVTLKEAARAGLAEINNGRELQDLYTQGVSLQAAGEYDAALTVFSDLIIRAPDYRDVGQRILQIKRRMEIADLLAQADQRYSAGALQEAADRYLEVQTFDNNFQRAYIAGRLFEINFGLGQAELAKPQVQIEEVEKALTYFQAALAQDPINDAALQEQRLARTYLAARERYDRQEWREAVARLRDIYELDSDYLGNTVVQLLYDAYIGSGDLYRNDDDLYLAYDQYSKAADLPGVDTVVARGRIAQIAPFLTPTPTPTITPTPSSTPTITPIPPTAAPTPTPTPRPLSMFRGRIVFKSDNPEQPGYWVMNPDGTGRDYLGEGGNYDKEAEAMIKQHQFSPDGRYRTFVTTKAWDKAPQVYVKRPDHPQYGPLPDRAISQLTGVSYDPVWSPDGGRIAFVSQENESDDIWIANADGTNRHSLVRNPWEWDKHPSWSPDSRLLVFWSNRTGTKQIFVMDTNGQNVRNLSNVPWDEYDPIWIR